MFEFGSGQEEAVAALIGRAADLELVDIKRDLQDLPRVAIAQRI
jgi:methylase of polypeptide subunit release factors